MRANEVHSAMMLEGTMSNMAVLRDTVDMFIDNMPYDLEADTIWERSGRQFSGLRSLIEKYQDTPYAQAVQELQHIHFILDNRAVNAQTNTMGAYAGRPQQTLWLNVAAFMRASDSVKKTDVLKHRWTASMKSFRAILLHEVRHFFQSVLYSGYFYASDRDTKAKGAKGAKGAPAGSVYKRSPVELDAAWVHHLEDIAPADYPSVSAYVDAVMTSYASYKSLRGFERAHFRRKTARYYFEMTKGGKADPLQSPAKERLAAQRNHVREAMVATLSKITDDIDLRNVAGYDPGSGRFLFPARAVRGTAAVLSKGGKFTGANASIAFLVLALTLPDELLAPASRFLRNVSGVTKQDALDGAEGAFAGGWDWQALARLIDAKF